MRNLFNSVRVQARPRNKFGLSYRNDLTADYGFLYPIACKEVLAGDIYRIGLESFIRTQPLRAPAFMTADASFHWFFVPNRLTYEDWKDFITRGRDGDTDYDKPYITPRNIKDQLWHEDTSNAMNINSLADYLNFPSAALTGAETCKIDVMPFSAYQLIYNEYYRDENLIPEVYIPLHSGNINNANEYSDYLTSLETKYSISEASAIRLASPLYMRRRAWRKDYFTSALPFVQKGSPISLIGSVQGQPGQTGIVAEWSSSVPLAANDKRMVTWWNNNSQASNSGLLLLTPNTNIGIGQSGYESDNLQHVHQPFVTSNSPALQAVIPISGLQTNVMTISDLRVAMALQQWWELNARTGSDRYFEYLLGHFGVRDKDSRLQRPEYIGGFSHSIQVSEVEQTSATGSVTPQGNLAGKGLGYAANSPVTYRIPEHGFLLGIMSIRPHTPYYQGMPRQYQRWDAFDYYDPLFDHLSEQAIKKSELHYDYTYDVGSSSDPDFGYTPRFSEYRSYTDEIHGDFRETLNYWVSPRYIDDSTLALDRDFIEVNAYNQRLNESFAFVGTAAEPSPHFLVHLNIHISAIRPMSKYATPYL